MHKSRWGFYPCSFEEFCELRALWKAVFTRRRQVAAWRRWSAKAPHNRVKRPPDGPPVHVPEPPLPSVACRKVTRPSGKVEVEFAGPNRGDLRRLQEAYRLARCPRPTAAEVEPLPVSRAEVAAWRSAIGG
jgi:hypothetical protein